MSHFIKEFFIGSSHRMTVGLILSYRVFSAIVFGAFGLGRAFAVAPDFSKAKTATARMFKLMDYVPPIDKYNTEGLKPVCVMRASCVFNFILVVVNLSYVFCIV